jgi:uncharacterized membrane protein (UPF0127 family)
MTARRTAVTDDRETPRSGRAGRAGRASVAPGLATAGRAGACSRYLRAVLATLVLTVLAACGGGGDGSSEPSTPGADLSAFAIETITVGDVPIAAWIADTPAKRSQGLMRASAEQLEPTDDGTERGMLFVFPDVRTRSFFMRDTGVPLDLAYAGADGTIFEVVALVPFDETPVPSTQPVAFALEVRAGRLDALGLGVGDRIVTDATTTR